MGVATYYFKYVCGNAGMMSSFMISASIAEVVGLIVFPKVAKFLSRKTSFLLACLLPAFGLVMLLLVGMMKKVINTISARREGKIDMTQQLDESGNTEPSMFIPTVTEKAGK